MLFKTPTSPRACTAAVTQTHPGEGKLWRGAHHLNMAEETKSWHQASKSLHYFSSWNRDTHSAGKKESEKQLMDFISFCSVAAVKLDDMHSEFTSQLDNHWDNSVRQRQHQKELKNINIEQPHCAGFKPHLGNVWSDSGSCEFLQEAAKQQGRYGMVLAPVLLSSLQQTAVKVFPELEIAFGPLCLMAHEGPSHKSRATVVLYLTLWARKQFHHQCSKKAIALGCINGVLMFRAGELRITYFLQRCTFWRCSCQETGCETRKR